MFWVSYALLWSVVLLLAAVVVTLARDRARSLPPTAAGPLEGTIVPNLVGTAMETDGEVVMDIARDGPLVVVFLAAACEPCWGVRGAVARVAGTRSGHARFVACCAGDRKSLGEFAAGLGESTLVVVDEPGRNARAWGVRRHPAAVGVDRRGSVRGVAYHVDAANLEALAERAAAR